MLIEAGFDIAFQCPAETPMLLQLNIHPSRESDLRSPDTIRTDPPLPATAYLDLFGNRVTRLVVPPGLVTFSDHFVIANFRRAGRDAVRFPFRADREPARQRVAVPGFESLLRQ